MMQAPTYQWLRNGDEAFAAALAAIATARKSVRLETYIFGNDPVGHQFRAALEAAARRGLKVRALADSVGSFDLPSDFWDGLRAAGGQARWFNPVTFARFGFRDHRKLLVCDEQVAFVGGFNLAKEYAGDGITRGWCDHGCRLTGPLVEELAVAFDRMFQRADFRHSPFTRFLRTTSRQHVTHSDAELFLTGPGRGFNSYQRALRNDLDRANNIQIISAYFLPPWRIRRALTRRARQGCQVQLLLPGKSDVPLAQLAGRNLYARLLRAGVEIREYQPQILHAKMVVLDDAAYIGSTNLDSRGLHINYELMVRLSEPKTVAEAQGIFQADWALAQPIELASWQRLRSFWTRLKERAAYFLLARVDPYLARQQRQKFSKWVSY